MKWQFVQQCMSVSGSAQNSSVLLQAQAYIYCQLLKSWCMSQELRNLPRQSSRALYGEGEGEADTENDGNITSGIGQVLN